MPRAPKQPKTAKAATPASAIVHAIGDLVQFFCPVAQRIVQEKVTGFVEKHGYVTVESNRHFPAKEVSPVAEP